MTKPFDHYVEQQKRKAEQLEASIRLSERKRIVELLQRQIQTLEFERDQFSASFAEQINNFIFITKDYIKLIEGVDNDQV
jgi:hypothetical protein